jgi:hypothetical protein
MAGPSAIRAETNYPPHNSGRNCNLDMGLGMMGHAFLPSDQGFDAKRYKAFRVAV